MGLTGIKGLAFMAVIVLLVSGCSSQSKPEYDPLEVIAWEKCIDAYVAASPLARFEREYVTLVIEEAQKECKKLKPTKQG